MVILLHGRWFVHQARIRQRRRVNPMPTSVLWFRRDLRLRDHPALLAAAADGAGVLPLFVLDPALLGPAGDTRTAWLFRSLAALQDGVGSRLLIRSGDPADVVPQVAAEAGATSVHVSADSGPYGRRRDAAVADRLAQDGRKLVATGTPYAVGPGPLLTGAGTPFQVFGPFSRAWLAHGWPAPAAEAPAVRWAERDGEELPQPPKDSPVHQEVGEAAAQEHWAEFVDSRLGDYDEQRNRPDVAGTSAMSAHLKYGEVHPRTLLHDLSSRPGRPGKGNLSYRTELCWREFYADVLWHRPDTAREYLRPEFARMRYDEPAATFEAWRTGTTGFPLVDAGMRQLLADGWMHNRLRMITASFLVKDLHVEWQHGARWFMQQLRDGDLASNQHGWQWVAGCGTDAAPYFRIFNPVTQGKKFDPDGTYVRRYVPELRHLSGGAVHEPWRHPDGHAHGYPEPIVDHAAERQEALDRYAEIRTPPPSR